MNTIIGKPPRPLDKASRTVAAALANAKPDRPTEQSFVAENRWSEQYVGWANAVTELAWTLAGARGREWRARFCYYAGLEAYRPGGTFYAETSGQERELTMLEEGLVRSGVDPESFPGGVREHLGKVNA